MGDYTGLNRAQLSYEYLHTNSTTHEFLFGALAELLDNARDANATKMEVYTVPDDSLRGGHMVCFLDNGHGMDPVEANNVITFGRSNKRVMDSKMIGQYGNGLKSGAMRIGNDFMLFTKKAETMSCVFLSRTFHEEENVQEVIVPLPSFDSKNHKPYCCNTAAAKYRYNAEMNLIYKYSPFKTQEEFMKQFDKISDSSGTLVIIYNLKLADNGEPELMSENSDIVLNSTDQERNSMMPECWSFRAYASVLYAQPYMKIYIEHKKVRTKLFQHSLHKPKLYKYLSTRFKDRSKKEAQKAQHDSQVAEMRAREAESKARQLEKTVFTSSDKNARANLRKAQDHAEELRDEANLKKKFAQKKQKDEKLPKILEFIFGINLERRTYDGLFIYNCSRLIKMYQKVGPQMEGGLNCSGVVGIVDVPYQVLEPTHNKQDFADAREYRHLLKVLGEYMEQYWKDVEIAKQGVTQFWEYYGYLSNSWQHPPSNESKYLRRRAMQTDFYLQCDSCLKWRIIPFASGNITRSFLDEWTCSLNSDMAYNKCEAVEQKANLAEGKLQKEKSKEAIKDELERKMDRVKKKLKEVQPQRVASSRGLKRSAPPPRSPLPPPKVRVSPEKRNHQKKADSIVEKKRFIKSPVVETTPPPPKKTIPPRKKKRECDTSVEESEVIDNGNVVETADPKISIISRTRAKRGIANKKIYVGYEKSPEGSNSESEVESAAPTRLSNEKNAPETAKRGISDKKIYVGYEKSLDGSNSESEVESVAPTRSPNKKNASETAKKDPVNSVQATSTSSPLQSNDSTEDESRYRKRHRSTSPTNEDNGEDNDNNAKNSDNSHIDKEYDIGSNVEVLVKGKWHSASVIGHRPRNRIKIKFEKHKNDREDKSIIVNGSQVRLKQDVDEDEEDDDDDNDSGTVPNENSEAPSSSTVVSSSVPANGSSITTTDTTDNENKLDIKKHIPDDELSSDLLFEVSKSFRNCLRYFLPPNWTMNKEHISELSPKELSVFPLSEFVDHYEGGIKKIMDNFQVEVENQKKLTVSEEKKSKEAETELESTKTRLFSLRRKIAKLLKSIHEEFDIDTNDETDRVDELVQACIEQLP